MAEVQEPLPEAALPEAAEAFVEPGGPVAAAEGAVPAAAAPPPAEPPAAGKPSAKPPGATQRAELAGLPPPAYWLLAALCVTTAGYFCLARPEQSVRGLFTRAAAHPVDAQLPNLLRLNGGAILMSGGAAAAMGSGGWLGMGPRAADLLRAAMAAQGAAKTFLVACYGLNGTISPLALPMEVVLHGFAAAVPLLDLILRCRGAAAPQALARQLDRRLAPPSPAQALVAVWYALTILFFLTGASLAFAAKTTLMQYQGYAYGSAAFLLARLAGVADLTVVPAAALLLKGAAQRGALPSRPARLLNAGLLAAAGVHLWTLVPLISRGECGWAMVANASTWGLASLASAAGLLASTGGRAGGAAGEGVAETVTAAGGKED